MKYIDLIIPTRNRWKKLLRCLHSIPQKLPDVGLNIIIICDGDSDTALKLLAETNQYPMISQIIFVRDHSGSVYCRNLATQCAEDAVLYATDDIEFKAGAIETAVEAMHKHYPDDDGIVGFSQTGNKGFSKAGVALVGQRFLQRYPNRKLFYPKYFHFSCQEIERLGNHFGKIHLEEKAELIHYHPSFIHGEADETHREARVHRKADLEISLPRRQKHKIWGLE